MVKKILLIALTPAFCTSLVGQPAPKREMRGTWIATVEGIDWPSTASLDAGMQQREMIAILDNVVHNNLNTIAFQIRPTADAFYRSDHEPWSHWLTGTQGLAPEYDPLQFVIEECDKRGIAVHVWINPFRVWASDKNLPSALRKRLYARYDGWLTRYGTTHYFQPADSRSREHIVRVVADIVRKYDIDAVHMDDYFYPYRISGQEFPDESYFRADPRGFTDKEDWRRDNVDRIIQDIHRTIISIKPWVEFGISPFGVWRNASRDPRGSATRGGQTNYDDLYADILKWEERGWIDYTAPQLYWHIGNEAADYQILARWWNNNAHGTPLYIGHALYRVEASSATASWRSFQEIIRQIRLNRTLSNIKGSFLYSAKFLADPALQTALREVYPTRSLWPVNPRVAAIVPETPRRLTLAREGTNVHLSWQPAENNRRFVVYRFAEGEPIDFNNPNAIVCVTAHYGVIFPVVGTEDRYFVTALSPTHHESEAGDFRASGAGAPD